jgi:hypothetical protein
MPRPKKKYSSPAQVAPAPPPQSQVLAYSFDLKGASQYTRYSIWALRKAIYEGQLSVVNQKPYIMRRIDLEAYVDSRVQKVA